MNTKPEDDVQDYDAKHFGKVDFNLEVVSNIRVKRADGTPVNAEVKPSNPSSR